MKNRVLSYDEFLFEKSYREQNNPSIISKVLKEVKKIAKISNDRKREEEVKKLALSLYTDDEVISDVEDNNFRDFEHSEEYFDKHSDDGIAIDYKFEVSGDEIVDETVHVVINNMQFEYDFQNIHDLDYINKNL